MKPLKISTGPPSNKQTKHKYSNSSIPTQPSTTKSKAPKIQFKIPTVQSSPKSKLIYSPNKSIQISPTNSNKLKIPKFETIEDLALWSSFTFPVSPEKTLKGFAGHLTAQEQSEILSYPEVYYIGIGVPKTSSGTLNFGYDDNEGNYLITTGDHLSFRFEILSILGGGSFGKVVKVKDHKTKQTLAIKIIKNKGKFFEQAREEIEILSYLNPQSRNNRVIDLKEFFVFRCHVCLVFELLDMNLYQFGKIQPFAGLSMIDLKRWSLQILTALKFLDMSKVIHCDLKPENILFENNEMKDVVVIDLGSAAFNDRKIYNYIQSRYYRAPEVILGLEYSSSIDIWSFGCILAELVNGYPLFVAENEIELIQCIMEILGPPPSKLIQKAVHRNMFFEADGKAKVTPNSKGKKRLCGSKRLRDMIRPCEASLFALIRACLEWDQLLRITAEEALNHSWFTGNVDNRVKHVKSQSVVGVNKKRFVTRQKNN
jgi:dual specificity tyrosine-phosphorylation-regulated kinase 2/3/4